MRGFALPRSTTRLEGYRREADLSWVDERQKRAKFDKFEALARSDDTPIKPERVVSELQKNA